jgi:hypothetical protein
MTEVPRITVEDARRRTRSGDALLVCAYVDEEKCRRTPLEGGITLSALESRLPSLPKSQELIFYCA